MDLLTLLVMGGLAGVMAGLLGIGGGSHSVPFMTRYSVPLKRAIGTSAVIGLPIAARGAIDYIVAGWNEPKLPAWSVGYVSLSAFASIVVASTTAAPLGARLAHRLPEAMLRRIFYDLRRCWGADAVGVIAVAGWGREKRLLSEQSS